MCLHWPQQICDGSEGKYRLRFHAACGKDECTTSLCPICNEIEQRGLAHAGLAIDRCGATTDFQRVDQPTEKPSLMITTHDQADVIERTGVQVFGFLERVSTW